MTDLLGQKNIIVINKIEFFLLSTPTKKNINQLISDDEKFSLPIKIDYLISNIFDQLIVFISKTQAFNIFHIQNILRIKFQKINLNEIHNIILSNLFLNFDRTSKEELYYFIWPKDKIYSQNKLDTHLTNLKNILCGLENFKKILRLKRG